MAQLVLIKDLTTIAPSIANIVVSTMLGESTIERYDPSKQYQTGEKVYIIDDGEIIVKESIVDNPTDINDNSQWEIVKDGIGGSSTSQNPNSYQDVPIFSKNLASDIGILTKRLGTLTGLSEEGLRNTLIYSFLDSSEVTITGGKYELGRVYG